MYKLFMALRYLRAHRIIYFSIAGVAVGIIVMIIVTSVMGGFARDIRKRIRGMQAHLTLTTISPDIFLPEYEKLVEEIRKIPHVRGAAPRLEYSAWLGIRGTRYDVQLIGIVPELERGTSEIEAYFRRGGKEGFNFNYDDGSRGYRQDPQKHPGIVVGSESRARVGYKTGALSARDSTPPMFLTGDFEVVGRFCSGMSEYDLKFVFVSLEAMQDFMNTRSANAIAVELDDYDAHVEVVREKILDITHKMQPWRCRDTSYHSLGRCGRFATLSWEEAKVILLQAVAVERGLMFIILFFIVIVAGFNIIAIYTLMVRSKQRDIGILRALGASEGGVTTLFLMSGTFCGLVGCVLGIAAGLLISQNLNEITDFIETQSVKLNGISHKDFDGFPASVEFARGALRVVPFAMGAISLLWAFLLLRRRKRFWSVAFFGLAGLLGTMGGIAVGEMFDRRPIEWLSHQLLWLSLGMLVFLWIRFYRKPQRLQWTWTLGAAALLGGACWFFFDWLGRESLVSTRLWIAVGAAAFPVMMYDLQHFAQWIGEGAIRHAIHFVSSAVWFVCVLAVAGSIAMCAAILVNDPRPGWPGINLFPKDIYYIDRIPVFVDMTAITWIVVLTLIVSLIFSIYPARRASSMDPIEAIRQE